MGQRLRNMITERRGGEISATTFVGQGRATFDR
jgi:hypothetical protein